MTLLRAAAVAFVIAGCDAWKKEAPAPAPAPVVDAALTENKVAPSVPFAIREVHRGQQRTFAPPWHAPGGSWTFVDAELSDGTRFGLGFDEHIVQQVDAQYLDLNVTVKVGETTRYLTDVTITSVDGAAGGKLVSALANALRTQAPPSPWQHPIMPERAGATEASRRAPSDGGADAGSYFLSAGSSFPGAGPLELEIGARKGAFSAVQDSAAFLAFLARTLRDGPKLPRAPETDPSVSARGPKAEAARSFGSDKAWFIGFASNSKQLVYRDGDRVMQAPVEEPTNASELIRLRGMKTIQCSHQNDLCLVVESIERDGGGEGTEVIHLVDGARRTKRVLSGPFGAGFMRVPPRAIAPDGSWLALEVREPTRGLSLVPAAGGEPRRVDDADAGKVDFHGWDGTGGSLRALVGFTAHTASFDLRTGTSTSLPREDTSARARIAPDGKHRFECGQDAIDVIDVATGAKRSFAVFPEDAKRQPVSCAFWLNSRHLRYEGERTAILDIETMKLSYVYAPGAEPVLRENLMTTISDDLQWIVTSSERGLRLARLVVR